MKIRKTKKRYKTMFRTQYYLCKRKKELTTRYVRIRIAQLKVKHHAKSNNN